MQAGEDDGLGRFVLIFSGAMPRIHLTDGLEARKIGVPSLHCIGQRDPIKQVGRLPCGCTQSLRTPDYVGHVEENVQASLHASDVLSGLTTLAPLLLLAGDPMAGRGLLGVCSTVFEFCCCQLQHVDKHPCHEDSMRLADHIRRSAILMHCHQSLAPSRRVRLH